MYFIGIWSNNWRRQRKKAEARPLRTQTFNVEMKLAKTRKAVVSAEQGVAAIKKKQAEIETQLAE